MCIGCQAFEGPGLPFHCSHSQTILQRSHLRALENHQILIHKQHFRTSFPGPLCLAHAKRALLRVGTSGEDAAGCLPRSTYFPLIRYHIRPGAGGLNISTQTQLDPFFPIYHLLILLYFHLFGGQSELKNNVQCSLKINGKI